MTRVRVFSTTSCPYCYMAKDFLAAKGVEFEDIDVGRDYKKAMEMVRLSGQRGVPVIDIDGEIILGFDQTRISQALGI
ncbi:MAG: NrdH-redoxin [Nanoarchaeota archaeon]|nr:NrdH-redoxin [Nanoarchaeota archaeon]